MPLDRAKTTLNAEKYLRAGKLNEAIAEYKRLAEDSPRDMNTINKLGDLCARAGKNPDAIRYFLRIAEFYAADGFFLKAIAMYKKVSKLDPANMDCFQKLAGLYQQQGLTIEAKAQYMAVADHFVKAGQFKKATEVLPKVLEIEPDNIKVRMSLADLMARAGGPKDAAREYCQVARDLAGKGMFDEAIRVAQKGMKASPGDPDIMSLMLSLSKEAEKSPGDLISAVEKMARANGDNPRSLALLGEAYLSAGRSADADKVFKKLQGMEEGAPPEVSAAVGRYHLSKDAADLALEWLARAADQWAEGPRSGEAAGLLDEFLRAFPDHRAGLAKRAAIAEGAGDTKAQAAALRRLAQVLAGAGEIATAVELAERLVGIEPENLQHAETLKSLKARAGGAPPARPAAPGAAPARPPGPVASRPAAPGRPAPPDPDDEPIIETTSGQSLGRPGPGRGVEPEPGLELSLEDAAEEAPSEGPGGDEDYGPDSRIQEIQAADEEGEPEDDEFITEHFTEAEVFIKYGLFEKAKQQLLKILGKHPQHVTTHAKLKEIYYEEGDKEKAVAECLTLAGIMKARGRNEEAQDLVNEAIRIDPNNPRIKQFGAGAPAAAPPAAPPARPAAAARPAPAPTPARPPARPAAPAPQAKATAAARKAPTAPPELELEEVGGEASLEIEAGGAAEPEMEIEIDLPEEEAPKPAPSKPPAKAPAAPARPAAASPKPAAAPAAAKGRPEKIPEKVEEETPEDLLGGLSFGEDGEISIETEGPGTAPAAAIGRAGALARDPDPEKLGEVDFYIDQGLLEEARAVLFQLQKQYPDSREVAQRFERANRPSEIRPARPAAPPPHEPTGLDIDIERAFGAPAVKPSPAAGARATPRASKATPVFKVEATTSEAEGDFFDLAGELDKSLAEAQVAVGTQEQESLEGPGHSLDEIFKAFKRGVEQQVDSEDYDTHYNLGIAYKEMGLVDEAIGEFQYAAKDPARTVECCEILGLCFRDKGMPQLALKWYQKALSIPGLLEQQATGLRYDIAEVYREQGDYGKALQFFTEAYGHDSTYRDVAAKIKEMRRLLG